MVSYEGNDEARDGEERPTRLCLAAEGSASLITADCHNDRIDFEGTLAIGPKGGCIAIEPPAATIAAGEVKYNCPSDRYEAADCPD